MYYLILIFYGMTPPAPIEFTSYESCEAAKVVMTEKYIAAGIKEKEANRFIFCVKK